jgi:hypothetical protein
VPVGPTPEIVNRILDLLETQLVGEIETRQGEFDEGPITHLVGSWYLSAIHSQLARLDDSELPSQRDAQRLRFPFVTGEETEPQILHAMARRFVVAEVLSRETDQLRALSWQMVGALVEEEILNEEPGLDRMPHVGDGDHLERFRKLSQERLEVGERELSSDYGEYLRLIRKAFLEWLRAFRGVHIEALGEFAYVWVSDRRELREKYRSDGEPYVRGDEDLDEAE